MRRWFRCVAMPVHCSSTATTVMGPSTCFSTTPGKVKVHVRTRDGTSRDVHALAGMTLMEALRDVAKLDVAGSCNGSMECGTCHVYLSESSFDCAAEPSEREEDLLAKALEVRETSRLSCQVVLTEELDGLEVELPSYL